MATRIQCAEKVQESVLSNSVILRHIFCALSLQELLTCRQVGRLWKREASRFIRDHRICYVILRGRSCCSQLEQLNTNVPTLVDIPFNGFKLCGKFTRCSCPKNSTGLTDIFQLIPLHHLYISERWHWLKENCMVASLFSKVLTEENENLKSLTLENFCILSSLTRDTECMQRLPILHQIEFVGFVYEQSMNLASVLVKKCPNLKCIRGKINLELLKAFEPSKRHLIKDLVVDVASSSVTNDSQLLPTFFPLEKLTIQGPCTEDGTKVLASLLEKLIASCGSTLNALQLSSFPASLLELLPNFPPCQLPLLTTIYISGRDDVLSQKQWLRRRILRFAPNISQVRGAFDPETLAEVVPNEMRGCIKSFTLWIRNAAEEQTCTDLANSMPQLESLEIYRCKGPEFYSTLVKILEMLLLSCQHSLTYCYMDIDERLPLAELRMPCMQRFRKLRVWTANMTRGFVRGLESINYSSCLPSLLEFQLYATPLSDTSDNLAPNEAHVHTTCHIYSSMLKYCIQLMQTGKAI